MFTTIEKHINAKLKAIHEKADKHNIDTTYDIDELSNIYEIHILITEGQALIDLLNDCTGAPVSYCPFIDYVLDELNDEKVLFELYNEDKALEVITK